MQACSTYLHYFFHVDGVGTSCSSAVLCTKCMYTSTRHLLGSVQSIVYKHSPIVWVCAMLIVYKHKSIAWVCAMLILLLMTMLWGTLLEKEKFENFHGQPIWHKSPAIAVLAWTDASCSGHMSLLCCIFGPDPLLSLCLLYEFAQKGCCGRQLWFYLYSWIFWQRQYCLRVRSMDFLTEAVLPESKINGFFDRGSIAWE